MSFYVGQKVVCVNNSQVEEWLVVGREYVVSGIEECRCGATISVGIPSRWPFLQCSVCGVTKPLTEMAFDSRRFRPIDPLHEALDRIEENHTVEPEPAFA